MGILKTVVSISVGLVVLAGILIFSFRKKQEAEMKKLSPAINIEKTWELPPALNEISGFAFINAEEIAAIQDEEGSIFIYDISTSKITGEIPFGDTGDYEGIALVDATAYVLISDGTVLQIENYRTDPQINKIETPLTRDQDIEGITYDKTNNRLLLSVKEKDVNSENTKGIYALNLNNLQLQEQPVLKIDLTSQIFEKLEQKKMHNRFQPSEIAINPKTSEIYAVEGTNPKLLILGKNGEAKNLYVLDRARFPQPEGIAFSPNNDLFVSSEGNPGLLHKISIKQK